ncbi:MAG: hypothetical protein M0R46_16075 [Candidatus Muirbacterium halophilum]|nr:hypothetical protein [Candidatus Muirbacterium halophilum]MCK9477434.1 hypothetical protein [Candidatus Muirbacterium halophilum]
MRKVTSVILCGVLLSSMIIATGCGKKASPVSGKSAVIEKSMRNRPKWTSQLFYEDKTNMYISGQATGKDYALSMRLAKSEAVKNLVEAIETKARSEFSAVVKEHVKDGEVARYIDDSIAMVSENVRVSGLFYKETYYEKRETQLKNSVEYHFDVWALLSIKKDDYYTARENAVNALDMKAKMKNSAELAKVAEELKKRLLED